MILAKREKCCFLLILSIRKDFQFYTAQNEIHPGDKIIIEANTLSFLIAIAIFYLGIKRRAERDERISANKEAVERAEAPPPEDSCLHSQPHIYNQGFITLKEYLGPFKIRRADG